MRRVLTLRWSRPRVLQVRAAPPSPTLVSPPLCPPMAPLAPLGTLLWGCLPFSLFPLAVVWSWGAPSPGCAGAGGMAACFYLLCRADPGCSRGLGHRHSLSAQMSLWEVSGHLLFLFLFFAHFLIVSSSHPFDLFQKPAVCVVYNDSLACLFFSRLVGPSFSH